MSYPGDRKICPDCGDSAPQQAVSCACGHRFVKAQAKQQYTAAAHRPADLPQYEKQPVSPQTRERIGQMMASTRRDTGPYWTVDRVVNQKQCDHIKRQATHFGELSAAGRFFRDCVNAGKMTEQGEYIATRIREPGEDEEYAAEELV